jgi:hypothetical protein
LRFGRKLFVFCRVCGISIYFFRIKNGFDLPLILPVLSFGGDFILCLGKKIKTSSSMFGFKYDRFYLRVLFAAAVVFVALVGLPRLFLSEEDRLRRFVWQGKKAVEAKSLLACSDLVSADYQDRYGNDRDRLIFVAREFFGYYRKIFVRIEKIEIDLNDSATEANVEIVALVIGQTGANRRETILEGEKGRFRIRVVKEDKSWKLAEIEFFEPAEIMDRYAV